MVASTYLEASAGAPVLAALRVEGEELAGEDARQRRLLVGTVVHAGRSLAAANMNQARCGQVETKRIEDKIEHYSQSFLIVVQMQHDYSLQEVVELLDGAV